MKSSFGNNDFLYNILIFLMLKTPLSCFTKNLDSLAGRVYGHSIQAYPIQQYHQYKAQNYCLNTAPLVGAKAH